MKIVQFELEKKDSQRCLSPLMMGELDPLSADGADDGAELDFLF